jgi:hypothetical protein
MQDLKAMGGKEHLVMFLTVLLVVEKARQWKQLNPSVISFALLSPQPSITIPFTLRQRRDLPQHSSAAQQSTPQPT